MIGMNKKMKDMVQDGMRVAENMPIPEKSLERKSYFTGGRNYARFAEYLEKHGCIAH